MVNCQMLIIVRKKKQQKKQETLNTCNRPCPGNIEYIDGYDFNFYSNFYKTFIINELYSIFVR